MAKILRNILLAGILCTAPGATGVALSHERPVGCTQTEASLTLLAYRSDGSTLIDAGAEVSECEKLVFRAKLEKGLDTNEFCAFQHGTFTLTTPDGVEVAWDDVPCVGGGASDLECGSRSLTIAAPYTVSVADVQQGTITATATYEGGITHDDESDSGGMGALGDRLLPVAFCRDNSACTTDTCNPFGYGETACSFPPKCIDHDVCTLDGCFNQTGECVFIPDPNGDPSCPDCGDAIVQEGEDCDDGNTAAGDGCSPECTSEACGDANADGSVTATDALFALRAAVGIGTCPLTICDVNGNGQLAAADALAILRFAVGGSAALGCPT